MTMFDTTQRLHARGRGGQVVIFLMMAFVALMFLLLWNVDIHRLVSMKSRSQDAGDAAALAAARWQASALNLVGELNLMHALALADGNVQAIDALTNIQARLCLTGPLAGMVAAQQAAKQNGIHASDEFASRFQDYIAKVASQTIDFPAFYDGAREEYVEMLYAVLADGIAAQPPYYDYPTGNHILFDPEFYDAVANRTWCWFFLYHPGLLEAYTDHTFWPALPPPPEIREVYPLRISPMTAELTQLITLERLREDGDAAGIDLSGLNATNVAGRQIWYCYDAGWWGRWTRLNTDDPFDPFPVIAPPKPEYDYAGADALASVRSSVQRMTPGLDGGGAQRDAIRWSAAAKAFGYVGENDSRDPPARHRLVVPAFRNVRLIPLDASSGGASLNRDLSTHFDLLPDGSGHLQIYVATGAYQPGCWYCQQLQTWDQLSFRQQGIDWLEENSHRCVGPGPGPGGRFRPPPRTGH
jgi:hypothetical protein